jgi:nitrate/TMAO reductase-like tetraheme cytochrome c subunit
MVSLATVSVLAVLATQPLFEQGLHPLRDVTAPPQVDSLSARACGTCHEAEYAQWATSRHAAAFTNALFRASFATADRRSWCVNCHAPLPEQRQPALGLGDGGDAALLEEGVTCAACHLRGGEVLSARVPSQEARNAHPVRHELRLATAEACTGCHQFNVPIPGEPLTRDSGVPMQDTGAEWASSRAAAEGKTCQSCHMGGAGHHFPGAHTPGYVAGALSVTFRVEDGGVLIAELRSRGVGHRVPTGDPFRRLRLVLCRDEGCEEPLTTRTLARSFQSRPGTVQAGRDTTVPVETDTTEPVRRFRFRLAAFPGPLPEVLHWRLDYLLAEPQLEGVVSPELMRQEVHRGTVALRGSQ